MCKRDAGFFTAASGENDVTPPPKPPTEQTRAGTTKKANLEMNEGSEREREKQEEMYMYTGANGERNGKESQTCRG